LEVLARQRREAILAVIQREGGVRVSELVRRLGVSDATVRHDLEVLARNGLVAKVYGGATRLDGDEPGFAANLRKQRRQKEAIGPAAAAFVEPGAAVAISAGTTTWAAARYLAGVPGLTVVTNSVPVAQVFRRASRPDQTVILTGGVRTPSDALVGSVAVQAIRNLHFDVVLMGVHGMTVRTGFTTPNLLEAEANRAMVEAARRLIVLADHSKWGAIGISTIAQLREADVLICDAGLADPAREALRAEVGRLVIAP
jgi:DeoR/GlpR family transcriptional regulator of sugar metabolism